MTSASSRLRAAPRRAALLETQLILDALRPDQTAAKWESLRAAGRADWDRLAVRAIVLGLAPQLHVRLTRWQAALPARTAAKLGATYKANAVRNQAIFEQLAEMLALCRARGLRPIALKGVHLATAVYPEPALRPMNDIDLLFTPDELPAVEALLTDLGYRGKYKSSELGPGITKHTSTFRRDGRSGATPNPYLSTDADRIIEPHSSLEESWFGLKVDITPGVRARAGALQINGQDCRVLAPEDLLLHLCVHFCFHLMMGQPALVQMTDLTAVLQAMRLDWPDFVQCARTARAAPYAAAALRLAHRHAGADTDSDALRQLARETPAPLRSWIEGLDLAHVLRRTQQAPLTTVPQRIRRGIIDRIETARWAPNSRARWQVWKTAFSVAQSDTGRMLIGREGG